MFVTCVLFNVKRCSGKQDLFFRCYAFQRDSFVTGLYYVCLVNGYIGVYDTVVCQDRFIGSLHCCVLFIRVSFTFMFCGCIVRIVVTAKEPGVFRYRYTNGVFVFVKFKFFFVAFVKGEQPFEVIGEASQDDVCVGWGIAMTLVCAVFYSGGHLTTFLIFGESGNQRIILKVKDTGV